MFLVSKGFCIDDQLSEASKSFKRLSCSGCGARLSSLFIKVVVKRMCVCVSNVCQMCVKCVSKVCVCVCASISGGNFLAQPDMKQ